MTKRLPHRTQDARTRATTEALLRAAERLFGGVGYEAASLDDIAVRAGVTKGALYHHFPSGKSELFEAVVQRLQKRLIAAIDAASENSTGPETLRRVLDTYFEIATVPAFHRITLLDAPAVLGPGKWREIESAHALRHIRGSVDFVLGAAQYSDSAKSMLALAFFGAAYEATFAVVGAPDRDAARRLAVDTVAAIVEGAYTVLLKSQNPTPAR